MFDPGALVGGLITGLREGVEAALIVSIVVAWLVKSGNASHLPRVWVGVASAVVASAVVGVVIYATVGDLPAPYGQAFEAITLLVAAAVVTWMLFWMRRAAASVSSELRAALGRAVGTGGALGLAILAFSAVIREGLETAIFLTGQATAASVGGGDAGALSVLLGAVAGLALAAVLGVAFYRGSARIDLGRFFRWTGIALVFIAAGLVSQAVHELVEIGLVPFGTATAWNLSAVLPDDAGVGQFLRAILGYSAAPETATVGVHLAYLAIVLGLYLRPLRPTAIRLPRPVPAAETVRPGT